MVCLQETAFVSVEMAFYSHRQDAAACVSLSKSTMSKTRPEVPAPPITPGGGEERRLYPPPFSLSIASTPYPERSEKSAKIASGPLGACPDQSVASRLKGRRITPTSAEIKRLSPQFGGPRGSRP